MGFVLTTCMRFLPLQVYYLSGVVPTFNDVPLPTSFQVGVCLGLVRAKSQASHSM